MLKCPKCRAGVPASDVNLSALVAKCVACDHVFRVDPASLDASEAVPAESPGCPRSITFERAEPSALFRDSYRDSGARPPTTFTLRRRWFQAQHVFLLFFCVAWDSFLVFWYAIALAGDPSFMTVVFPIAHVAVGVGLTYSVLAGLLNRTTLTLSADALEVRHGPLLWRGNGSYARAAIRGVERADHAKSRTTPTATQTGTQALSLRLTDGRLVKLLSGVSVEEARFVHWAIVDALRA